MSGGTNHFLGQRLSAVVLLILGLWFAYSMLAIPGFTHGDATAFIAAPLNGVMLLLLVVSIAIHSSLGVQVVIEDYVHGQGLKHAALISSRFAHGALVVAATIAIVRLGMSA